MRKANAYFDRITAAAKDKDRGTRQKKLQEVQNELNALKAKIEPKKAGRIGCNLC